jgi:protein involved in polysaccharide export with SLBB domain
MLEQNAGSSSAARGFRARLAGSEIKMKLSRNMAIAVALTVLPLTELSGQTNGRAWDPTGLQLTRLELQEQLVQYKETANSSAYSGTLRNQARDEAALIRQRLEEGDIRVGDRISLIVDGQTALTTDFTVVADRQIVLPEGFGIVPLVGVLRSELQAHMTKHLSRYLKEPAVRAQSAIRVEIVGAVGKPGFYMVPSDMLLTDVLMMAGGPASTASLDKVKIKRAKEVIWDGDRLREAMIEGRTLDQLSVRAGDAIDVPAAQGKLPAIRSVMMGVGSVASFVFLLRRAGIL